MKIYLLIGLLTFSVTSQAQNIFYGATNKQAKKNDYCSYYASVPQLIAVKGAPAGVQTLVSKLNAESAKTLAKMDKDYNATIAHKEMCTESSYSYVMNYNFRVTTNLGATVASLYTTISGYTGGAHGFAGINTVTFNSLTGETYENLGAFFDQSKLDALKELILKKAKEVNEYLNPEFGWNDWSAKRTSINQIDNFYVSGNGLVVYFQQYEIGSYAEGIIEAKMSWWELEELGLNGSQAAKALLSNKIF